MSRLLPVLFLATYFASLSAAQTTTGEIVGRVTDVRGGTLPGATVTVRGPALLQPRTAATNGAGAYLFSQLPAGTYSVSFTLTGFFPLTRESVVVAPGAHVQLNVSLAKSDTSGETISKAEAGTTRSGLQPGEVLVRLETPFGNIDLAIDTSHAPVTAANFLKYVDGGFYDGGRFHRATRPDNYTPAPPNRPPMELIQGGINEKRKPDAFPPIPLERTSVTGLKHVAGTVSMARSPAADTATSDFFILLDDQPSLDFGGKRFDDGQGAAAFGRVVSGLDVVRKIQQQPVQGQQLTPPVPIVRAARLKTSSFF